MKWFSSMFKMYVLGLRLTALHLLRRKIRRGLYLLIRPIDYWRTFEFPIAYEYLLPTSGEHILDVGSPKLFCMHIVARCSAHVYAMDIYDDQGLTDTMFYKSATGRDTLHVLIGDVRKLPFGDGSLDKVFSISVLEHVFPPEGGDVEALREIARVLRPGGKLVLTVPFTKRFRVEYLKQDVYERKRTATNDLVFYQRRYDAPSLQKLFSDVGELEIEQEEFICERFWHWRQRELWNVVGEGNKLKRLSLAPLYPILAMIFLKRTSMPLPNANVMAACIKLQKKPVEIT